MYPITSAVKALFDAEQKQVLRITGTDKNGRAVSITNEDIVLGGFTIDHYCCNGDKLEVGTAIAGQMTLKLNNTDGRFNNIVFEGTELFVEVGIADWSQSSPTVNWVPCGRFTPDLQPRKLNNIDLTCLDRMTRFDVAVDGTALTFPTTVAGLVGQVDTLCGVTLAASIDSLPNAGVSIAGLPTSDGEMTYRNLIQWCAGIMATNAWFDWNGQLRFTWYNNSTGYETTVANRFDSDVYENDLTVTGAVYTNAGGIEIVEGTDDYAIDLTGNALAGPIIATVLPVVANAVSGFSYRPFTATVVNAPYLWPMDVVTFEDKDGNDHTSVLTNVAFGINGNTALESRGMTYALNRRAQPKGVTKEQAQLISEAMERVETDIDDSLTQQEIFNRLTDNGAAQGLILYNGQLYVNASYIQSGTLVLGGLNNQNGTLQVKDASGNVIGSWTKDGIAISQGSLNITSTGGTQNTETVTVSIKELFNSPFRIAYNGQYIDSQTDMDGHFIKLTDNNDDEEMRLSPSEIVISDSNRAWFNLSNIGAPVLRLISQDSDVYLSSERFYLWHNNALVLDASYANGVMSLGVNGALSAGDAAQTRANLEVLGLSGGTVTGAVIRKVDADFGTPPSTEEWNGIIPYTDSGNDVKGGVYNQREPDGSYRTLLGARGSNGWGYIAATIDSSGNQGYVVSHPQAMLSAIGVQWTKVTGTTSSGGTIGLGLARSRYMVVSAWSYVTSGSSHIVTPMVTAGAVNWSALVETIAHAAIANTAVTLYVAYIDFGAGNIS